MSREDEFDGMVDMVDAADLNAANKRTQHVLDIFSEITRLAVEQHPQGDLHDFLAFEAVAFAACVMLDGVMNFSKVWLFFEDCGFDRDTIEEMFDDYDAVMSFDHTLSLGVVRSLEIYQKCRKELS